MVYFDNSATTRPCRACIDAMVSVMENDYANASSLHGAGVSAHRFIDRAKASVADIIGCTPQEILLTAGGTYSNNIAVAGTARTLKRRGNRIVISSIEHPSVSQTAKELEKDGFEVVYCNPLTDDFEKAINKDTVLVSCMLVNNETGLILPADRLKKQIEKSGAPAYLHIDAVQAFGKIPVSVKKLGCDFLTVSAHKVNGPKGIGALYVRRGVRVTPVVFGGEQEGAVVPGTYNTPAAAGFSAACRELKTRDGKTLTELNAYFLKRASEFDFIKINSFGVHAPHIINITFDGYLGENVLHLLEEYGIYTSQGSACSSHSTDKGRVLTALGSDKRTSDGSLRVSFDYDNTVDEIDEFFGVCAGIPEKLIKLYNTRERR